MVSSPTDDQIKGGRELLEYLDSKAQRASHAFWMHLPEQDRWRLMLYFKNVQTEGPKAIYQRIQRALRKVRSEFVALDDIALLKPGTSLLSQLSQFIKTGPGLCGVRFTGNMMNGVLLPDCYIYRVNP